MVRTRLMRKRAITSIRRYWRRTRLPRGRRARSNRLFRRFIRRRAIRPELKHVLVNVTSQQTGNQQGAAATFWTTNLSPLTLAPGVGTGFRIGTQVNFIKVDLRAVLIDQSNQTAPLIAPTRATYHVRMIVWTPRRPYEQSAAYAQGLQIASLIDYDYLTVHNDSTFQLSPSYMQEALNNDIAGGPRPSQTLISRHFKFPRKVKLTNEEADLDPQKDILYVTFKMSGTQSAGFIVDLEAKTWYYDA